METPSPPVEQLPFEFHGAALEYFRIWLVNIFLTVLTLGIYSAWAKVRRKKYFYGNTRLQGESFDYHGEPRKILKGRLLVALAFAGYVGMTALWPGVEGLFALVLAVLTPWLVVQSRLFNAHNSSYRNIRFHFVPDYREAYKVLLGLYLLSGLTLGVLLPYAEYRRYRFLIRNSAFGTTGFRFNCTAGAFYHTYLRAAGVFALVLLASALVLLAGNSLALPDAVLLSLPVLIPLLWLFGYAYFQTGITNLVLSQSTVGSHQLSSTIRASELFGLYLTNLLGIVFSLGLLLPWASLRLTRYRLQHLRLTVHGSLNDLVASTRQAVSAVGEEFGEFLGLDLGL